MAKQPKVLVIPGIGNSGPDHWQTLWEKGDSSFIRVEQRDWDNPNCEEWVNTLEAVVKQQGPQTVVVAHSLGCLLVAQWAAITEQRIMGAMLVAVPDPKGPNFPVEAVGFSDLPTRPFSFRSVVVASTNDPYGSPAFSQKCAQAWNADLVEIGSAGHINASSGLGIWQKGLHILAQLRFNSSMDLDEQARLSSNR